MALDSVDLPELEAPWRRMMRDFIPLGRVLTTALYTWKDLPGCSSRTKQALPEFFNTQPRLAAMKHPVTV